MGVPDTWSLLVAAANAGVPAVITSAKQALRGTTLASCQLLRVRRNNSLSTDYNRTQHFDRWRLSRLALVTFSTIQVRHVFCTKRGEKESDLVLRAVGRKSVCRRIAQGILTTLSKWCRVGWTGEKRYAPKMRRGKLS